jgi:hypothetical protein
MAEAQRRDPTATDPGAGGEWIFKKGDQVFGPIPAKKLLDLLYKGEVDGNTPVAGEDGEYRPLSEVPFFVIHVKKAEAQVRVQREVTGVRQVEQRRNATRIAATAIGAVVVLVVAGVGANWLAVNKPWRPKSETALLEDFGDGIFIASAPRIGMGRHSATEEIEVVSTPVAPSPGPGKPPKRPGGPGKPAGRDTTPTAPSRPPAGGDDLTVAQYDLGHIQAVIAREQRTLAPCLKSEARRSPDFVGEIPIEFAIGNDGKVSQLWIDQPRFKRGELHECLFKALRAWSFRSFPGGRPTVSLSFRIGPRT